MPEYTNLINTTNIMLVENPYIKIENWIRNIFKIPDNASIKIYEESTDEQNNIVITRIIIKMNTGTADEYRIMKPASAINYKDIIFLHRTIKSCDLKKHPVLARLFRFFGWWFIFAGALSAFSVCPVCGQVGCPIGLGTTGILAGCLALLKQNGKQAVIFIKAKLSNGNLKKE